MWQAEHVRDLLKALYPATEVTLLPMSTRGDEILDRSLAAIGGKGLFIKELEVAMAAGEADLAIHSCKDVPMELPDGFTLAAILEREDPHDAFVSTRYASLDEVPAGGVIGTSSLRREAQLRERYPHLVVKPLRGNLDTRLGKLDRGEYDAIVLAVAGLKRLGAGARIRAVIPPEASLPAVGQGALAIEVRSDRLDVIAAVAALHHPRTAACVRAERAASRALGGSCQVPLAAHATEADGSLTLRGLVASPDGRTVARATVQGPATYPETVGDELAAALRARGAAGILAALP
jgi:hydroxymethylbilane synthase